MKATGIVRRIDDLGRVVIPKEIRRNLHIRDGEPLEIYIEDGGVMFKKYSLMSTISSFASQVQIAFNSNGISAAIFDNNNNLSGAARSFGISTVPDEWIDIRHPATKWENMFVTPILLDGEQAGFICYRNNNDEETIHDTVKFAAKLLANMLAY